MDKTYTKDQIEAALLEEAAKLTPPRPPTLVEYDKPVSKPKPKTPLNKIVFLQVEEQYKPALLDILSSNLAFNEAGFRFVLLPLDTKIMNKEDIIALIGGL